MAGKYRALLIGNSTYPADEHNLQTLKGPAKDISALNRALVDRETGLFADVDVTLLPEASSTRALRTLSRFFGTADRDDVLLLYFSGHGKLDQTGRLHLCMQDTETNDLLSSAVSSTRINEFADASRARNVVIVLDCCHAGAFRGGDFGDTVAGPGRYVLTSCRGTQLANDATVENGTSYFTQHLVDGLTDAAADHDGDGFVSFSDIYAYVDRQLREEGKQIPQRRVDGDGDLRLAKRPMRLAESPVPDTVRAPDSRAPARPEPAAGRRPPNVRRRATIAGAVAALVVAAVTLTVVLLNSGGGNSGSGPATPTHLQVGGTYTASAPWRLRLVDDIHGGYDAGCTVALATPGTATPFPLLENVYTTAVVQVHQTGSFTWQINNPGCLVAPVAGSGTLTLPATIDPTIGDSDAFAAPARVAVQVKDYQGDPGCRIKLYDPSNGQLLDFATATPGSDTVVLQAGTSRTAYVHPDNCAVRISAAP